jgi:hypothetical protein
MLRVVAGKNSGALKMLGNFCSMAQHENAVLAVNNPP